MPKAETKATEKANTKRSRTLYMSDEDWAELTELANENRRGRTDQIVVLVRQARAKK